MIRLLLILFLATGINAAQPPAIPPQYNFIFVVDTSHSMSPYRVLTANLVRWAIHSGFDGQIQKGDSIDIWTYDDENHITRYPPQIWGTQDGEELALAAGRFVEDLKFRGRSKFSPVAADLNSLLPHTKGCLVMILTDGDEPFSGLSVDIEINEYISREKKEYSGPRQPYMVSLAAVNGRINKGSVHHGDEELLLARLPARPEPAPVLASSSSNPEPGSKPVKSAPPSKREPSLRSNRTPKSKPTAEPPPPIIFDLPPGSRLANFPPAADPDDDSDPVTSLPAAVDLHVTSAPVEPVQPAAQTAFNAAAPLTNSAPQLSQSVAKTPGGTPKIGGLPIASTKLSAHVSVEGKTAHPDPIPFRKTTGTNVAVNSASKTNPSPTALKEKTKPTNVVAATKNSPPSSSGSLKSNHPPSSFGGSSISTIAIPIALLGGLASVGLAVFVLLRKAKARHTGSIISRSLQQ